MQRSARGGRRFRRGAILGIRVLSEQSVFGTPFRENGLPQHRKRRCEWRIYLKCLRFHWNLQVRFLLEPIQEDWIHEQRLGLVKRLSMMRIMARRTKAATVLA